MKRLAASMALFAAGACAAPARLDAPGRPLEAALYRFSEGLVLAVKLESRLSVSMAGTDPSLLIDGHERPIEWSLDGEYENRVIEAGAGLPARVERHVRNVASSGSLSGKEFGFRWDDSQPPPVPGKISHVMDRFVAEQVVHPLRYEVDEHGGIAGSKKVVGLARHMGMKFWPMGAGRERWTSVESIAVPVLHNGIELRFNNVAEGEVIREGRRVRMVRALARLEPSEGDVMYRGEARAVVEFDLTHGRLERLELEIGIRFAGMGTVPGGGEGVLAGEVSYRESQACVP